MSGSLADGGVRGVERPHSKRLSLFCFALPDPFGFLKPPMRNNTRLYIGKRLGKSLALVDQAHLSLNPGCAPESGQKGVAGEIEKRRSVDAPQPSKNVLPGK